jgi:SAM-dependent methyltransferase
MEQICEVQLTIKSMTISLNATTECCLLYHHTGKNSKKYRTEVSTNFVSPFWQNLEPLFFQCSLKELVQECIIIQVVRRMQQQFVTVGTCKIELHSIISMRNNQTLPFNGNLFYNDIAVGQYNGLIESQNVPYFAQLTGGKNVGYGIVGGAVFFPGVNVPTLPQFPNDFEAQKYYQRNKHKILSQQKQNPTAPPRESLPQIRESPNTELYTLNTQSEAVKLSNDRLIARYDCSYTIASSLSVKSSLPIFDLADQYFEATVLDSGLQDLITVGLAPQQLSVYMVPGATNISYGYESTGNKLYNNEHLLYGPSFTVGDTIGCGITPEGAIYYTKNGEFIGIAHYPITSKVENKDLFCTIALHSSSAAVRVNFGQENFKFNTEQAKLPSGWTLNSTLDRFDRFFFVSPDGFNTFVDPRFNQAAWTEQNETAERLCNTLMRPLTIHYSDDIQRPQLYKKAKWNGIKSARVLNALKVIPRAAFVPEELYSTANIGQHVVAEINDKSFDVTSTMTIARALDELNLNLGSKFLEIGSGCGYCTALAGYIVGDTGIACGSDISESMIQFAKERVLEFSKKTGISLKSVVFTRKNFSLMSNSSFEDQVIPMNNGVVPGLISANLDEFSSYDAIFCGLEIQRSHLKDIGKLLNKGGIAVAGMEGMLKKLWLTETLEWREQDLMKIPGGVLSEVVLPTATEKRVAKIEALKTGLTRLGYSMSKVEAGLKYLGYTLDASPDFNFDDPFRQITLMNYCSLVQHPTLVSYDFSPAEIIDALESFPSMYQNTVSSEALIYLSNTRVISSTYQIPTKPVKEVFQIMRCNLEVIQRFLGDAKYCIDQIQRMKRSLPATTTVKSQLQLVQEEYDLVREVFQALMSFHSVDVALSHLMKLHLNK